MTARCALQHVAFPQQRVLMHVRDLERRVELAGRVGDGGKLGRDDPVHVLFDDAGGEDEEGGDCHRD